MAKTVTPTGKERVKIAQRLIEKYPQMYKPGWDKTPEGKSFLAKTKERLAKVFGGRSKHKPIETTRTKAVKRGTKQAGVGWEKDRPSAKRGKK